MIGFNYLGKLGQLGNQMFQYASILGVAEGIGTSCCIPKHDNVVVDGLGNRLRVELFDAFKINPEHVGFIPAQDLQEKTYEYDDSFLKLNPDIDTNLVGFFQTEKYFKHVEDEIRKDFTFKKDWLEPCRECFGDSEYIGLHIRRTDYVQKQNYHPLCTLDYYERALKKLPDIKVIIVSDDPDWCKNQSLFESDRFLVSDSKNNIIDMCILSLCKYHIIANSSFSWWGAWLGDSEKVIAPSNWFADSCASKSVKDMEFSDWTWL